MKPFFTYYGGKWRAAPHYPKPVQKTIIEPFAGSAGYALRYHYLNVVLNDLDPLIYGLWDYLIHVSPEEISRLPENVTHVDDHPICQEAKWLIGFWLNKGSAQPKKAASSRMKSGLRPHSHWGKTIRERIANQVEHIKHWQITNTCYDSIENQDATWFVDPPYQSACGRHYRTQFHNFDDLSSWCRTRQGQVIVCEKSGATWLPFVPLGQFRCNAGGHYKTYCDEAIWKSEDKV